MFHKAQNPNQYEDAYLGSSCVIDGFEDFSTYYSSFPDPELNNISAPHLFQSSTFPAQPTFQLSASTPITPHVPPRPFSRCSDDSQDMVGALSPEPCASERSARSNRAQSMPEPSASARFSRFRQHLTPEAQEEPSPVTTPHYIQAATPLMQDLRTPDLTHSSPPSRFYTPIAPNPLGLLQMHARKHSYSDDETDWLTSKRHKSTPSSPSIEMTEEDTLLLQLKDAEALSWKDIQGRFSEELGKTYQVPALQMRLKRLRERMRVWTEGDIHALRLAHEFWLNQKFDIISSKVRDYLLRMSRKLANNPRCLSSAPPKNGPTSNVHANGKRFVGRQNASRCFEPLPTPRLSQRARSTSNPARWGYT